MTWRHINPLAAKEQEEEKNTQSKKKQNGKADREKGRDKIIPVRAENFAVLMQSSIGCCDPDSREA